MGAAPADGGAGPRQTALRVVMLAVLVDYLGVGMMRTMMPFYAQRLGAASGSGATLLGGLEAAYGVGQMGGAAVLGRLSDVWGRRVVLTLSFAGSFVGYTMAGLATTPTLLLASRIPVGLAKQTVTVSRAVVADCTALGQERSVGMSRLVAAFGVGYAVGPLIGSHLATASGSDAVPAFATAGLFVMLLIAVALVLPETRPETGGASSQRDAGISIMAGWRVLLADPGLLRVVAVTTLPEVGFVMHTTTTLASLTVQELGESKEWLASVNAATATIASTLCAFALPALSGRAGVSDTSLLLAGDLVFAAGTAALALWPTTTTVWRTLPLVAFGIAVLRTTPAALASQRAGLAVQGGAMGLLDAVSSCCRVAAPLVAGLLIDARGASAAFAAEAVLATLGAAALLLDARVPQAKPHAE